MAAAQTFGRYELLRTVGTGGMAQVVLARQVGPEGFVKPCVLKLIAQEHQGHESVRRMFLEEARVTALLNHPNVVQTFDYGEVQGVPYMAMELVDGVNLAQLCRTLAQHDRWLPLQPALEMMMGVLEALDYAHRLTDLQGRPLRLIHRDVSPQNTLLSRQGVLKLTDFGIARHDGRETRTIGLHAKGKPGYMAPEQAMGGEIDARADLFAVGVMLTELISARRLLQSKHRVNQLLDIENRVRTLCGLRAESPPELNELASRLCALEPNRRPASARDAAMLLRKASARVPPSVPMQEFLRSVFDNYLEGSGPSRAVGGPEQAPWPGPMTSGELPAPPAASASGLGFEQRQWEPSDADPTGTGAVYEGGWPELIVTEPPRLSLPRPADLTPVSLPKPSPSPAAPSPADDLDLVPRSSSVEAMQYFRAQESEQAARGQEPEPAPEEVEEPRERARRVPYVIGQRTSSSLPSPEFADDPKRGILGFEDPALKKALASIEDDGRDKKKPFRIPPVVPLLGAGLLVGALAVGVLALISGRDGEVTEVVLPKGSIEVDSDPPGGAIFLDGRRTGKTTPATLSDLPTEQNLRLSVKREGYRSNPPDVVVQIPQVSLRTTARFTLEKGRAYKLVTEPPEATVTFNGHRLGSLTPTVLPVVPFGETATITFEHEGFLPMKLVLDSRVDTPTVAKVQLEPAQNVEISSNPPGASLFVDGVEHGQTPAYDVLVPLERRFWVRIEHRGFKTWRRRVYGKKLGDEVLVADLEPLPFLALPWSREEKKRARDLDREHTQLARKVASLKVKLARAQARQAAVENAVNASVGDLAEVQRQTDLVRDALLDAEQSLVDLETQMENMRQQLLLREEDF